MTESHANTPAKMDINSQSISRPQIAFVQSNSQSNHFFNNLTKPNVYSSAASQTNQPSHPSQSDGAKIQHRGTKHFSHTHPLYLSEVLEKDAKTCSCCEKDLVSFAYICKGSQGKFFLHQACFKLPKEIQRKSHLEHPLILLSKPPYKSVAFACSACLQVGYAFDYHCSVCEFDLQVDCAPLPESVVRERHDRALTLLYSPLSNALAEETGVDVAFICDLCDQKVNRLCWMYYCEKCDFGTHLECLNSEQSKSGNLQEEAIREAQLQLERLQLLMRLRDQNS